jgi:hypothetical protein
LGDPFPAVGRAGGRADMPCQVRDVPAAHRAVPPAAVGRYRGSRVRVVEADAGQDPGDDVYGQRSGKVRAERGGQGPARPDGRGAEQHLAIGGDHYAVRLDDRGQQSRGEQCPLHSGLHLLTSTSQVCGELDATPQRLAGPFRVQPGRIAGLRITLGVQVGTLRPQRPLTFAAGFGDRVEPRPFGLNPPLGRPGSFRRRTIEAAQLAFHLAGQRLGVEDQRADGRVSGPVDVAKQFGRTGVAGPGAPCLGQLDGGGVSVDSLFRGGPRVPVGRAPQLLGVGLGPEHGLLRLGEPPRFGPPTFGGSRSFTGAGRGGRGALLGRSRIGGKELGQGGGRAVHRFRVVVTAGAHEHPRRRWVRLEHADLTGQCPVRHVGVTERFAGDGQRGRGIPGGLADLSEDAVGVRDGAPVMGPLPVGAGQGLVGRCGQGSFGLVPLDQVVGGLEDLPGLNRGQRVVDLGELVSEVLRWWYC